MSPLDKKDLCPALNPLDYGIWGTLTTKMASMRKELRNIDDLKQLLTCQWKEISLETLHKTCGSWGKRLQAVHAAQAGHIEHNI